VNPDRFDALDGLFSVLLAAPLALIAVLLWL
jgi:hypothetical protein